jgi:hypothetical protein
VESSSFYWPERLKHYDTFAIDTMLAAVFASLV